MNNLYKLLVILALFVFSCAPDEDVQYDVVIIGGGLAGLSASTELNEQNVLILEKENYLGGRVLTQNFNETFYYDLGAVFALDTNYRSVLNHFPPEHIQGEPIAIYYKDSLYIGDTPINCFEQISEFDIQMLKNDIDENELNIEKYDSISYDIMNTFFKAVFPGNLIDYDRLAQKFVLMRYNSSHFKQGNQTVVENLIQKQNAEVQLNTKVAQIKDLGDKVRIIYSHNNKKDTVFSKKAISTTPATIAKKIIQFENTLSEEFVQGIEYAQYNSIAIGVGQKIKDKDISYLMPLNSIFSSILKQDTDSNNVTIFQLYIADNELSPDSSKVKTKAFEILNRIWEIEKKNTLFYDSKLWTNAGVIIKSENYANYNNDTMTNASKNIFLAGDYLCHKENIIPYGMIPAIISGKEVGIKVNTELSN